MLALLFVQTSGQETVVDIAIDNDNFATLEDALTTAGLVGNLQGEGPFTVFAPTNDAFQAAFSGLGTSLNDLMSAGNLTGILQFHVVPSRVFSANITSGLQLKTLEGRNLTFGVAGGVVTVTGGRGTSATVTSANISASNGVIHVINAVLLPPPPETTDEGNTNEGEENIGGEGDNQGGTEQEMPQQTVVEIIVSETSLGRLVASLNATGLNEALESGTGNFTVFAPNDEALEGIESVEVAVLQKHVVPGRVDLTNGATFATLLNGTNLTVSVSGDETQVSVGEASATIVKTMNASNGVVHVINAVLNDSGVKAHCSILVAIFAAMWLMMA